MGAEVLWSEVARVRQGPRQVILDLHLLASASTTRAPPVSNHSPSTPASITISTALLGPPGANLASVIEAHRRLVCGDASSLHLGGRSGHSSEVPALVHASAWKIRVLGVLSSANGVLGLGAAAYLLSLGNGLAFPAVFAAASVYMLRVGLGGLVTPSKPHPHIHQLAAATSSALLGLVADALEGPAVAPTIWAIATLAFFLLERALDRWVMKDACEDGGTY